MSVPKAGTNLFFMGVYREGPRKKLRLLVYRRSLMLDENYIWTININK